jgi:hypothetical protein
MSSQPAPIENSSIFNISNFNNLPNVGSTNQANFPTLQGTLTAPNGIVWGDGSFQNSSTSNGVLTVEEIDGTPTVANVNTIKVTNGSLTDNGGGVVTISTGGGGVQNPMTSNLNGGGYSITNVDTFNGLFGTFGEVTTETINDSAAQTYYNQGAIIPARWFIADIDPRANAEAHMMVVSRCLDPGFKQTTVFTVTAFQNRATVNVLMNLCESDTPIFDSIVVGDNGSTQMFVFMNCVTASSTWEIRVYQQQDDKGTGGSYGTFWNVISPATAAGPPTTTYAEITLGFQPEGQASMSGDLSIKDNISCNTLVASTSTTTNTTNTNELRDNGLGVLDTFAPLRMNTNDIQSAGIVGANAFVAGVLNAIVPVGHPTNGPLFVDSGNRRVGINVATPQEDLEIDGNLQLDSAGANKIKFYDASATVERAEIDAAASGATGGKLVFYTKEDPGVITARMTIEEDGRIQVTNRIENVPNPVNAQDVATKNYVDGLGAGYVTNPMTSDLNAGAFTITNITPVDSVLSTSATGDLQAATGGTNITLTGSTIDCDITAGTNMAFTGSQLGTNAPVDSIIGTDGTGNFVAATAGTGITITGSPPTISATGGAGYTDAQAVNAVQTCATNPLPLLQLACGFAFAPPVLAPVGSPPPMYVIPPNVSIVHGNGGNNQITMPAGVPSGTVIIIRNENNIDLEVFPGAGQVIENYNRGVPGTPSYVAPSVIGNYQSILYYLADLPGSGNTWYVMPRP